MTGPSPIERKNACERPTRDADRRLALLVALMTNERGRRCDGAAWTADFAEFGWLMNEPPAVIKGNEERVRRGETGHPVRDIVVISMALVIVAFILVAIFLRS
jgi:hypothetical protein